MKSNIHTALILILCSIIAGLHKHNTSTLYSDMYYLLSYLPRNSNESSIGLDSHWSPKRRRWHWFHQCIHITSTTHITVLNITCSHTFQGTAMKVALDLITLESGETAPALIPPMHSVGWAATPFRYLYLELGALPAIEYVSSCFFLCGWLRKPLFCGFLARYEEKKILQYQILVYRHTHKWK